MKLTGPVVGCFSIRPEQFSGVRCILGTVNNEGSGATQQKRQKLKYGPFILKNLHRAPSTTLAQHQPLIPWLAGNSVSRETQVW